MNDNSWLIRKLRALHANQSGAVAFLVMVGLLISMMMALVIYDTTPVARQKLEVQTAADTAAWSQSAVEARTMNMIAFTNIAKRIIMGQALYYEMLWAAWAIILLIFVALLVGFIIGCIFGGSTCSLATQTGLTIANIGIIMAKEATDLFQFATSIKDRMKEDLDALHKYQVHFQQLTPWWGWGESWRRGLRNGAYVSGWPVPDNFLSSLGSIPGVGNLVTSGLTDELPIELYPDYGELCVRSLLPDLPIHFADYMFQTLLCSDCTTDQPPGGLVPRIALYPAAGAVAMGLYAANCLVEFGSGSGFLSITFGNGYRPFQLKTPSNEAEWYRMTSNLIFAYRPGVDLKESYRRKYGYMSRDYETLDLLYKPDGFYGMARSEISYQNGDPDMWHPSWSTRMRPVALPGEWAAYSGSYRMVSAFNDAVPYLAAGAALGAGVSLLGIPGLGAGTKMGTPDVLDIIKAEVAFDAMTDTYIDGVAR